MYFFKKVSPQWQLVYLFQWSHWFWDLIFHVVMPLRSNTYFTADKIIAVYTPIILFRSLHDTCKLLFWFLMGNTQWNRNKIKIDIDHPVQKFTHPWQLMFCVALSITECLYLLKQLYMSCFNVLITHLLLERGEICRGSLKSTECDGPEGIFRRSAGSLLAQDKQETNKQ